MSTMLDRLRNLVQRIITRRQGADVLLASHLGRGGTCGMRNLLARESWLEQTLAKIPEGSSILDAGAGELQYKRFCSHLNYTSQDFGRYDGDGDGKGLQTGKWDQSRLDIETDITQIPEPDSSFDAVMCIEVLEHLPDPVDALRELCRLLKPGGVLILSAPFCSLTHMAPYFYQTGYSRYFYEYWLKELGVSIVEMQWNGNFFEYLAQELRRLPAVATQYSKEALSETEEKAQNILLGALNRFSNEDQGSEQFLSYGLHVLARKQ